MAFAALPPSGRGASRQADLARLDRDARSAGESFGCEASCDQAVAGSTAMFATLLWWIAGLAACLGLAALGLG
jgi:hypothetical protein